MRKLLCVAAVLGVASGAGVAKAAPWAAPGDASRAASWAAPVQTVQYYAPDWREREAWRLRREEEWRREAWRREHERRAYYNYGYGYAPAPYYGPRY